jgi:dihydroorotase
VELLLSLALKWADETKAGLVRALDVLTAQPAKVLCHSSQVPSSVGTLTVGGVADIVVFQPNEVWHVTPDQLHSQGKHTPFAYDMTGMSLPARVKVTVVNGVLAYQA